MPLRLVPKTDPDARQAVRERIKRMARPDGVIQCPRCGGRSMMTVTHGARIVKGRKTGGEVVAKDVCADCWKRGDTVQMIPEPIRPVK